MQNEQFEKKLEDLRKQHELDKQVWESKCKDDTAAEISQWRAEIGNDADTMLQSLSATLEAAANSGHTQKIALEMLAYHWKITGTPEVIDLLRAVIQSKTESSVREVAIYAVSQGLSRSMNRNWISYLAEIVSNNEEPLTVRRAGYVGIHLIVGKSPPSILELVKFSQDKIDLIFVTDCVSGKFQCPPREAWEVPQNVSSHC